MRGENGDQESIHNDSSLPTLLFFTGDQGLSDVLLCVPDSNSRAEVGQLTEIIDNIRFQILEVSKCKGDINVDSSRQRKLASGERRRAREVSTSISNQHIDLASGESESSGEWSGDSDANLCEG